MKCVVFIGLAFAGCGEPPPARPPHALTADASAVEDRTPAASSCETAVTLAELPTAAPASRCVPPPEPAARASDARALELAELANAPAERFLEKRDQLVSRGRGALSRLRELALSAPTARERGLAAAIVTRIEKPTEAKRVDGWAPSKGALMLRNPSFKVAAELEAAFAPYPELAFEALVRARDASDATPPHGGFVPVLRSPLFEVVGRGPDGYSRLEELVRRFPEAFALLVKHDPVRGTCAALSWLGGKLPPADDDRARAVLAALGSDDPLAMHLLRRALRDGPVKTKSVAADALARRKDASAVPDLLALLAERTIAGPVRAHLVAVIGPEETEKQLARLARDCRAEYRSAAAHALRWSPVVSGAQVLATLAGDAERGVRAEALDALAWMALSHREANVPFDDEVESAVIAAAGDGSPNVRRLALNALWRLVVEKRRPLGDAMRATWARALSDRDRQVQNLVLAELDDFFPGDAELIVVLLGDLGRVPDEWPHREALARARAAHPAPTREQVATLARSAVPGLRAIAEAWLARK